MNFKELSNGRKLICISAVVAIISLFLPWVDAGFISANGFQQQGYLLLLPFVYPVVMILQNKNIVKGINMACAIAALVFSVGFTMSKSTNVFGTSVNLAGTGLYVIIIASIIFLVGAIMEK